MNSALLNRKIQIQKKVSQSNEAGISTSQWTDDFSIWATISSESGSADSGQGMEKAAETITFTVRYCRNTLAVKALMYRIVFDGEIFDILSVDHVSYKGSMVRFYCQKARAGSVR